MNRDLSLVDRIAGDRELILEFLVVFARFEYALKRSKYTTEFEPEHDGSIRAEANWDKFSRKISFSAIHDPLFDDACSYLMSAPPKRQIINSNGELDRKNTPRGTGESVERYVLRLVQAVRNNLFHGGKYPDGPAPDLARNGQLLEASLTVLRTCVALNEPVRSAFEEPGE